MYNEGWLVPCRYPLSEHEPSPCRGGDGGGLMEYNTNKERLKMQAYGRNVQTMVEECLKIEDRRMRQAYAQRIVQTMAVVSQQSLRNKENALKLWNHLAQLADHQLDIDYPVEIIK